MKKQTVPTTSKLTVLRQACNYIPNHLVPKLARGAGNDEKARTFDEWSHSRKAAAKCHLRLDLQSLLPRFAIIDTARDADAKRAREVCAGVKEGEIVVFDKAYVDFDHLWELDQRGVFWVTRAKENLQLEAVQSYPVPAGGRIVSDELVGLKNAGSQTALLGFPIPLGAQLQPVVCPGAHLPVAEVGFTQTAGALWDSRRQLPLPGTAGAGVFPGIPLRLWDSPASPTEAISTATESDLKSSNSIRRGLSKSFGKPQDQRPILALMGCQ